MAHFRVAGLEEKSTIIINKKSLFFLCCFRVPELLRNQTPVDELDTLERDELLGFYAKPSVGSYMEVEGRIWLFEAEVHHPLPKASKAKRQVPSLLLTLTGRSEVIRCLDEGLLRIDE